MALTLQERLDFGSVEFALDVGRFIQSGFTVELAEVFQAIKVYVTILDKLDGREETFDDGVWLSKITDQRNIILHSLLSLLPAEHLPDHLSEDQGVLYEACRISGLIFGIGVVFPLPPHISPLPRLAMTLRAILCSNILSGWTSSSTCGILMWSITLGGIAAANTPHRRWFVAELELLTREQSIFNWESHKRILKQMLWQNNACDVAGQNMWAEVEELRLLGKIV